MIRWGLLFGLLCGAGHPGLDPVIVEPTSAELGNDTRYQ